MNEEDAGTLFKPDEAVRALAEIARVLSRFKIKYFEMEATEQREEVRLSVRDIAPELSVRFSYMFEAPKSEFRYVVAKVTPDLNLLIEKLLRALKRSGIGITRSELVRLALKLLMGYLFDTNAFNDVRTQLDYWKKMLSGYTERKPAVGDERPSSSPVIPGYTRLYQGYTGSGYTNVRPTENPKIEKREGCKTDEEASLLLTEGLDLLRHGRYSGNVIEKEERLRRLRRLRDRIAELLEADKGNPKRDLLYWLLQEIQREISNMTRSR